MFADDFTFLATGTNIGEMELKLNTLANDILNWTHVNSMALNIKKTKSILITSPQKRANLNENSLSVLVEGQVMEEVSEARVLGVIFDNNLTWGPHVEMLIKKLNSKG